VYKLTLRISILFFLAVILLSCKDEKETIDPILDIETEQLHQQFDSEAAVRESRFHLTRQLFYLQKSMKINKHEQKN
jgi:hypothetical protein